MSASRGNQPGVCMNFDELCEALAEYRAPLHEVLQETSFMAKIKTYFDQGYQVTLIYWPDRHDLEGSKAPKDALTFLRHLYQDDGTWKNIRRNPNSNQWTGNFATLSVTYSASSKQVVIRVMRYHRRTEHGTWCDGDLNFPHDTLAAWEDQCRRLPYQVVARLNEQVRKLITDGYRLSVHDHRPDVGAPIEHLSTVLDTFYVRGEVLTEIDSDRIPAGTLTLCELRTSNDDQPRKIVTVYLRDGIFDDFTFSSSPTPFSIDAICPDGTACVWYGVMTYTLVPPFTGSGLECCPLR